MKIPGPLCGFIFANRSCTAIRRSRWLPINLSPVSPSSSSSLYAHFPYSRYEIDPDLCHLRCSYTTCPMLRHEYRSIQWLGGRYGKDRRKYFDCRTGIAARDFQLLFCYSSEIPYAGDGVPWCPWRSWEWLETGFGCGLHLKWHDYRKYRELLFQAVQLLTGENRSVASIDLLNLPLGSSGTHSPTNGCFIRLRQYQCCQPYSSFVFGILGNILAPVDEGEERAQNRWLRFL